MPIVNYLSQFSLLVIIPMFGVASAMVWFSGWRLSKYADTLINNTGASDVAIGTLLLGGVTSLPEVVTTITASSFDNPGIGLNNLFGGVALQVTLLVIADAMVKKGPISSKISSPVVQLQGIVGILLLASAATFLLTQDFALLRIGVGSLVILGLFVGGFFVINYLQSIHWWKSDSDSRTDIQPGKRSVENDMVHRNKPCQQSHDGSGARQSFRSILATKLGLYLLLSSIGVLIGGYLVVSTGEALSEKANLSASFVGAIFIAFATSLPELSTTISLAKLRKYRLVFSNILGTNIYTVGFVFIADIFYRKGPVLNQGDDISIFGCLLGIVLTAIYLAGLSIRFGKTVFNLGYDSLLVLVIYLVGLFVMFKLQ